MTKTSILTLTALCLLAACSKNDVEEPDVPAQQMPIHFKSNELAPEASTRAVGLETKGVDAFYVWSYKTAGYETTPGSDIINYTGLQTIMEKYRVEWTQNTAGTTSSNVADWEYVGITDNGQYQNIKYWDLTATTYRFFGIAPCSATGITCGYNSVNPAQATEYDISFAADATKPNEAPYISKLWISNNNDLHYPERPFGRTVVMEFMKPVTKVRIELINEQGQLITDPSAEGVTSLLFAPSGGGDVVQKGTLTVSYPLQGRITFTQYLPSLTVVGDKDGSLKMERLGAIDNDVSDDYADWYFVLPHIEQDAFQLQLKVGGKSRMATVPSSLMSWNPNMEYTYRFKLTASDVQFIDIVQIGVTEWRTQNVPYAIYNW